MSLLKEWAGYRSEDLSSFYSFIKAMQWEWKDRAPDALVNPIEHFKSQPAKGYQIKIDDGMTG